MLILVVGGLVCSAAYFAGRAAARKVLRIEGVRPLETEAEERYFEISRARRAGGRIAGPLATYVACVVLAFFSIRTSGQSVATLTVVVLPEGPAARAGMLSGDRIVSINGVVPATWAEVPKLVSVAQPEAPLSVRVRRAAAELVLQVTPDEDRKIRIAPRMEQLSVPAASALSTALAAPIRTIMNDVSAARTWVVGQRRPELVGPVGIAREAASSEGVSARMTALILMLLAVPAGHMWPLAIVLELVLTPRRPRVRRGT
jgi:regulator of sigma E protease